MSDNGAHIVLKRTKPGEWVLKAGWDELNVVKVVEPFCLTKPEMGWSYQPSLLSMGDLELQKERGDSTISKGKGC